ncbi:MAG: cysteine desulfurase [Bacilli bacterium]|nr:cysteine desulfurase [Bacilli bacterium]
MIDVKKIREDFPMYRNNILMQGKPLVWLDSSSTTFKPDSVLEAVSMYYTKMNANSHRGDYDLCYAVDQMVAETRKTVAKFINAQEKEVVFTAGDTASMNLIAFGYATNNLTSEDEILITEAEHASNVLPWYQVAKMIGCKVGFIPLDEEGRITPENLEKVISSKTKIVSIAAIGNVLGYHAPVKKLAEVAHKHGAIIVVDGAQSVPHVKTDVVDLDCDFLCFSGHKMCGPTGIGILYGKYDLLCKTDAYITGGGNNAKFGMCGDVTLLEPPARFEAGTQNLEGIFGLKAAIEYLEQVGMDNIESYEKELKQYAVKKLKECGNVTIYNENSESGIVTFNIDGVFAQDAATYLNSKGIAVRSGLHCAKILTGFLKTPATVRASFYFYTSKEDIDVLADAVKNGGNYLDAYF